MSENTTNDKPHKRERRGRARNGQGTFYTRETADGTTYFAQFSLPPGADGRRRRRTLSASSPDELQRKLDELRSEVREHRVADPGSHTVADLCRSYQENVKQLRRPTTAALYAHAIGAHIDSRVGGLRLARIEPAHILDWLSELETAGVPVRAQQIALGVLQRALRFGVKPLRWLSYNPAADIDRPTYERPEARSLTPEQARTLLAEARKAPAWLHAFVAMGLCGLRRSETCALTWADAGLDSGRLRVRRGFTVAMDGTRTLGDPKTRSGRRELALPAFAREALQRLRESLPALPHPTAPLFPESRTAHPSNLTRRHFKPLAKRAGVPWLKYHELRHSFASLALSDGTDLRTVAALVGHSRPSTTLDIYSHVIPAKSDAAMARLGAML